MNKPNVSNFIKNVQTAITKHSPEILTGIGIAGMITTTVLAVKATPKAIRLMDERKAELETEKLPGVEIVKTTWKCYIPAVVTCAASVSCLIGASATHTKRNAALATAYKLSETALNEYKEKVIETIGEKKEQVIRDKVAEDRIKKNPVSKNDVIITRKGDTLCLDYHSGRYFKSDIDKIKKAVNEVNRRLVLDMYVSLNDFYDELELDHTSMGDDLGWNFDDGLVEVDFSSQIADDGTPCIVMDYRVAPHRGYSSLL